MGIDPAAVLAVISEQASRIAALEAENTQLRALVDQAQKAEPSQP